MTNSWAILTGRTSNPALQLTDRFRHAACLRKPRAEPAARDAPAAERHSLDGRDEESPRRGIGRNLRMLNRRVPLRLQPGRRMAPVFLELWPMRLHWLHLRGRGRRWGFRWHQACSEATSRVDLRRELRRHASLGSLLFLRVLRVDFVSLSRLLAGLGGLALSLVHSSRTVLRRGCLSRAV